MVAPAVTSSHMSAPELFYTPHEVAAMFRVSPTALNSQRKRGVEPGSLAVKVGGKHLYPKALIDHFLSELASTAQVNLGLDEQLAADLFRTPPTNTGVLSLAGAADRLGLAASVLEEQWEQSTYPGALGWRSTPEADIVFSPRDIDIWTQANADQSRQDAPSARSS